MNGWILESPCRTCGKFTGCTDTGHKHYTAWTLFNDRREPVASVQQFADGMPYYGTTEYGRTGPISSLESCQAACMADLEAGKSVADERLAILARRLS